MPFPRPFAGLKGPPDDAPAVPIAPLADWLARVASNRGEAEVDGEVLRARLADAYRDAGLDPAPPPTFDEMALALDADGWRRLALLIHTLDAPHLRPPLLATLRAPADVQVLAGFVAVAAATTLLTPEAIRTGPVRAEELARRWLLGLGARVEGETNAESLKRLARIDSRTLKDRLDAGKADAEARAEEIRKLRQESARRARRGKW